MTPEEFRQSDTLRSKLMDVLKDETLKLALDTIRLSSVPRNAPIQQAGVPYDSTVSHEFHRLQGKASAIDLLYGLTLPNDRPQTHLDQDYYHAAKEQQPEFFIDQP